MKTVIINIIGGCVDLVQCPEDVEVIIKDYDIEDLDHPDVKEDEYGEYQEIVF